MCGISAAISGGEARDLGRAVERLHASIRHRGPDGERFLLIDRAFRPHVVADPAAAADPSTAGALRVALGFRWLKIQDHDAAAGQPMASADGAHWLAFNGEIYNFGDLREELERRGRRVPTRSDTAVVLAAYEEWGARCFERFTGMWAIVIVDLRARVVVVSRDRFGIKPLHWAADGETLLLASEAKQIAAAAAVAAPPATLVRYLAGHPKRDEDSFLDVVRAVPPATVAEIAIDRGRRPRFERYWRLGDFVCADPRRAPAFAEACSTLETLLRASVSAQLVADVPRGSLLSGGLDSSLVAALATELGGASAAEPWSTFSLVFDHAAGPVDESPYVDAVTRHLGLASFRTSLDASWVRERLDAVAWTQEQPPVGLPVLAQYRTLELAAARGVRVLLDGQAADEVLGGYPRHQAALLRDLAARRRLPALARESARLLCADPLVRRLVAARLHPSRLGRALWPRPERTPSWLTRPALDVLRAPAAASPTAASADPSGVNRMLARDLEGGNVQRVLDISDRNAMAHSIEVRVPYLDHRVVEYAFQLPDTYKVGGGHRKRILRAIARRYLPTAVVTRKDKIGFGIPGEAWIRGPLRSEVRRAAATLGERLPGWLDAHALASFVDDFYTGRHRDASALFRVWALERWLTVYRLS